MNGSRNSDAKWYIDRCSGEEREYYSIFFHMCRKYDISWSKATDKDKAFIAEITRVTFERKMAEQKGTPTSSVRPSFCA